MGPIKEENSGDNERKLSPAAGGRHTCRPYKSKGECKSGTCINNKKRNRGNLAIAFA
jgi:hypothetical protein